MKGTLKLSMFPHFDIFDNASQIAKVHCEETHLPRKRRFQTSLRVKCMLLLEVEPNQGYVIVER